MTYEIIVTYATETTTQLYKCYTWSRQMPNKKAKARKQKRAKLNKKWATEGRTANQHKKWLKKNEGKSKTPVYGRR